MDGDGIEFAGGGAIVEPADGAAGHAHGIHLRKPVTTTLNRADNLVDIDRLPRTIPLADLHLWCGFVHRKIRDNFGKSCLEDRHVEPLRLRADYGMDRNGSCYQTTIAQPSRSACAFMPAGIRHGRSSDLQASYWLQLPSPWPDQCFNKGAFVPAYRCGAVPDSHRIPFSA